MKEIIKHYSTDKITVVWQPAKCSHSKICFHGLPNVFNPENRPWVSLVESTDEEIVGQINKCPSGALSILQNEGKTMQEAAVESSNTTKVKVIKGGPLMVEGSLTITLPDGEEVEKEGVTALCRCGASANKPYCDGSHSKIDFDT